VKFNSALVPPYVRRSKRVSAALPWLYLQGISTGDMKEALEVLVGEQAKRIVGWGGESAEGAVGR
jgi:putative transposase